jgi:endonuclease/exonuclease/phosphatase family metal-dependent hydrolase
MTHSWSTISCVATAALALATGSCRSAAPAPAGFTAEKLRIVSWNVHACASGVDAIVADLKRLNADVMCLQEVMQGPSGDAEADQVRRIADALGMQASFCASPMPDGRMQCVVILARAPWSNSTRLDAGTGRYYGVAGVVTWQGRPLRVVSVHLAGTYMANWQHIVRTCDERMREAGDLATRVGEWGGLIVLAGDFNATPGTGVCDRVSRSLVPVALEGATFPSRDPVFQFDHLLLSRGLHAKCAAVAVSLASDHRPVVVEITAAKP